MPKSSSMTMFPQTTLVDKTEQVIGRSYDWILRKKKTQFHLSFTRCLCSNISSKLLWFRVFTYKRSVVNTLTGKMSPQLIWASEDDRLENLNHKSVTIKIFFQASFQQNKRLIWPETSWWRSNYHRGKLKLRESFSENDEGPSLETLTLSKLTCGQILVFISTELYTELMWKKKIAFLAESK